MHHRGCGDGITAIPLVTASAAAPPPHQDHRQRAASAEREAWRHGRAETRQEQSAVDKVTTPGLRPLGSRPAGIKEEALLSMSSSRGSRKRPWTARRSGGGESRRQAQTTRLGFRGQTRLEAHGGEIGRKPIGNRERGVGQSSAKVRRHR